MAIHFTKEEFLVRKSKVIKELKKQNLDGLLMFRQLDKILIQSFR